MPRDIYMRITLLAAATMIAGFVAVIVADLVGLGDYALYRWTTAIMVAVVGGYGALLVLVVRRNPAPLAISLLGFPGSGKTVFLTVLFDTMMASGAPGIAFWPYGADTIERVGADMSALMQRTWLPPTTPGQVYYYRANARVGAGLLARRYKIEIGDYAGEHIHEFDTEHERWLHKTDYYKYVVQTDVVLLSIDCGTILHGERADIRDMENSFIAALHLLMEHKGVPVGGKLRAPVALVFMKADLARSHELPALRERQLDVDELCPRVSKLVRFCEGRCSTFKVFVASSVGYVDKDGLPPPALKPWGVVEPIVWALRQA
ncbi:MAG TPA: hypothetical protein VM537_25490 [Anaerolineae bacterium]|nr:hypothetical protein [Anaerolineae bacterium]